MTFQNEISPPLLPRQPPRACGAGAVRSPSQSPVSGVVVGLASPAAPAGRGGTHVLQERHGQVAALHLLLHCSPHGRHSVCGKWCLCQHASPSLCSQQVGRLGDTHPLCVTTHNREQLNEWTNERTTLMTVEIDVLRLIPSRVMIINCLKLPDKPKVAGLHELVGIYNNKFS